jgi:hypothetical protein
LRPSWEFSLSLSLECFVDDAICLLEEKVVSYLLDARFLLLWWNILGKEGFILLSLEIGKKFLHIVSVSSCFMVILV